MASADDTPMLPDPPDGAGGLAHLTCNLQGQAVSWARKRSKIHPGVDLIGKNLFRIEYEDGDRLKPRCMLRIRFLRISIILGLKRLSLAKVLLEVGNQNVTPVMRWIHRINFMGNGLLYLDQENLVFQKEKGKAKTNSSDLKHQPLKEKSDDKVNQVITPPDIQVAAKDTAVLSVKPIAPSRTNRLGKKRPRIETKAAPEEISSASTSKDVKFQAPSLQFEALKKPEEKQLRFNNDESILQSLDDKLGVLLQPQLMTEEKDDPETDSEMEGDDANSVLEPDSDMNEELPDQINPGLVQPPPG
ncbi:hypothetical protein SESBI_22493 [Sesbania bispinosa]|nr:hypothetical protein SESBI_22493 [Sesbania bispinosa]